MRIVRRLPGSQTKDGGKGDMHYYRERQYDGTSYGWSDKFDNAMRLTEQEVKKITKEVIFIYETHEEVTGKLLKIEVMDAETLELVSMCGFNPEVIVSRFELMDL